MSSSEGPPVFEPAHTPRLRGTLSIEWKLPLLITAVLAAGLAAFLGFTYYALARRSESVVRDRFARATQLVSSTMVDALAQRATATRGVVADPAVPHFLETISAGSSASASDSAAVARALTNLVDAPDSLAVILTDAGGRAVASAGKP